MSSRRAQARRHIADTIDVLRRVLKRNAIALKMLTPPYADSWLYEQDEEAISQGIAHLQVADTLLAEEADQ